jgi:hypothetical protein
MNPDWTEAYPNRERIRSETKAMLEAYIQAVLEHIPRDAVRDVFFKGSALKPWDSLVDYVPGISDVDIHVWTQDDAPLEGFLPSLEDALNLQARAEDRFFQAVPDPVHVPRVQLISLNSLLTDKRFVGSPRQTVRSRFGLDYPVGSITDPTEIRALDGLKLLEGLQTSVFDPMRAVDKPSTSLRFLLRDLSWRVGPLASRVLSVLGMEYVTAWGHNRTFLLRELRALGEFELPSSITAFYVSCWAYFLSSDRDGNAGRTAILAARDALRRGAQIAQKHGCSS